LKPSAAASFNSAINADTEVPITTNKPKYNKAFFILFLSWFDTCPPLFELNHCLFSFQLISSNHLIFKEFQTDFSTCERNSKKYWLLLPSIQGSPYLLFMYQRIRILHKKGERVSSNSSSKGMKHAKTVNRGR
jgi:hypothetical protein